MSSTDLITYLNYISNWETESDANIDLLISEHNLFVKLDDFESDSVVDKEFDKLINLAIAVRDAAIFAEATQIAADAAAVASIWSFGLGMAAFMVLEATELIEKRFIITSKSKELNEKLRTVDTDISSQINENVKNYVSAYKKNNNLIVSTAPKGLDTKTCRSNLMQFMAEVERKSKKLDAATFKKYAASARIVYNSDEINKVYNALDELDFSDKSEADVRKFMNVFVGLKLPKEATYALTLVKDMSIFIMFNRLGIAKATIKAQAKAEGIPLEEFETSTFEAMDAVGKFATSVAIVMSVVDVVLDIIDIVDIVEQSKKMCDELNTTIRANYKSYFNGIKDASKQYNAAIHGPVVTIESVTFPNVFLRIDGAEVTSFLEKGGGTVNSQYGTHEAEKFKISKSSDGYYTIESVKFPNVFLSMYGEEVKHFMVPGGGTVNSQYGAHEAEKFKISKSSDGYYTIESVKFPNVFLRMDGEEVTSFLEKGGGIVNCQYGAQAWERYKIKGFSLV